MAAIASLLRHWRRQWLGALALLWLAGCVVVAVLGYWVVPDNSPLANRQVPAAARQAPGHTITFVVPPKADSLSASIWQVWWGGSASAATWVAVVPGSVRWHGHRLEATQLGGGAVAWPLPTVPPQHRDAWLAAHLRQFTCYLGTDQLGRDVLSRLLLGTRVSLGVGFLAVCVSLLLGVSLGLVSGYYGGRVDAAIQWLMSVIWALPSLLLALVLSFALGKGWWQLVLAIGLSIWVDLARVVRGQVLQLRAQQWVQAAGILGLPTGRILLRHLLPNLWGSIVILSTANFATAILLEAGLSFLGLGIAPPSPTWGSMVQEGYSQILFADAKGLAFFPGLAIVMLILSLNLGAMSLRDTLDPGRIRNAG
ncbi:MAG: ABC transporter permease [Sphingobacteriia bacterium]